MSVYLYDEALLSKIRDWTDDTKVRIYGPDDSHQLFQVLADEQDDRRLELPMIVLTRPGGYTVTNTNRKPLSYNGLTLSQESLFASKLNAIPIAIKYQLDVYTRYMKEADTYTRELVFNIVNHNKVEVNIPYEDVNYKHISSVWMSNEIVDNTSVPEIIVRGQFYRMTINLEIDDAYLWDVKKYKNASIDIGDGITIDAEFPKK